jgi:hypothetical protein
LDSVYWSLRRSAGASLLAERASNPTPPSFTNLIDRPVPFSDR